MAAVVPKVTHNYSIFQAASRKIREGLISKEDGLDLHQAAVTNVKRLRLDRVTRERTLEYLACFKRIHLDNK